MCFCSVKRPFVQRFKLMVVIPYHLQFNTSSLTGAQCFGILLTQVDGHRNSQKLVMLEHCVGPKTKINGTGETWILGPIFRHSPKMSVSLLGWTSQIQIPDHLKSSISAVPKASPGFSKLCCLSGLSILKLLFFWMTGDFCDIKMYIMITVYNYISTSQERSASPNFPTSAGSKPNIFCFTGFLNWWTQSRKSPPWETPTSDLWNFEGMAGLQSSEFRASRISWVLRRWRTDHNVNHRSKLRWRGIKVRSIKSGLQLELVDCEEKTQSFGG